MFNYNLINPVNITYRNPHQDPAYRREDEENKGANSSDVLNKPVTMDEERGTGRHFPNGNKVQIDYTKNKINIAQVVEDFKSTIAAINAPEDISREVHSYLNLVEIESRKENPSREIILANLKNASKVSDKFIEDSLKKPSTVVQDWVNALFLQQVDLKSDPSFVNEAFRVQIPEDKKAQSAQAFTHSEAAVPGDAPAYGEVSVGEVPAASAPGGTPEFSAVSYSNDFQNSPVNIYSIPQNKVLLNEIKPIGQMDNIGTDLTYSTTAALEDTNLSSRSAVSFIETAEPVEEAQGLNTEIEEVAEIGVPSGRAGRTRDFSAGEGEFGANSVNLRAARGNFLRAKRIVKENGNPKNALKLYDEALSLVESTGDANLKAAIHFERGKVFDDFDYAELALKDYNSATKCSDNNLKTHAHLKMGRIYDDYVMFDPAVEQYSLAIETSELAENPSGKTKALRYLAALFADRYDKENTEIFNTLSVDSAYETGNMKTVSKTLMEAGENYEYIGEDVKALSMYKKAAQIQYTSGNYAELSKNYENASEIMERLGNGAKAMTLLSKALLYRQKSELQTGKQAAQA